MGPMTRVGLALLVALLLLACGEEESPAPPHAPVPAGAPAKPGAFSVTTRCGVPGHAPPVLFTGDAKNVVLTVRRVETFRADHGELVHSGAPKRNEWYFLPPLPSGLYRVVALRGEEIASCRLLVSDLAVVVKRSRREALVFVADAETGRPVPSARVSLRAGDATREGGTDSTGVLRADMPATSALEVFVTKKGRIGYAEAKGHPGGDLVTWLGTDRPAHAPGDEVAVAGIYRRRNGDYRAADAPGLRIEIRDERGSVVAAADPVDRCPGFFHGRVRIPPDPPPGPLWLVAGDAGRRRLVLAEDPPTGFTIRIDGPEEVRVGEEVAYEVRSWDAFGRPTRGTIRYMAEYFDRGRTWSALWGEGAMLPPAPYRFEFTVPRTPVLSVTVRVRDGIEVRATRALLVVDREDAGTAEEPGDLRLIAVPPEVAPGETIRLSLRLPPRLSDATVLTTMDGGGLGPHAVEGVEGSEHEYEVEAPRRPGRTLRFEAFLVRDRQVHRAGAVVRIWARSRRLPVAIAFEPEEPEPGSPANLVITAPADGRAVVAVYEDQGTPGDPRIEDVFYGGGTTDRFWSDSLSLANRSEEEAEEEVGGPFRPTVTAFVRAPVPVLWRADVRFEHGRAVVPVTFPGSPHRFRVVAVVATSDHRFGTATRTVRFPEPPVPPPGPGDPQGIDGPTPRGVERRAFRARPLAPGVSRGRFDLPEDAGAPRLTIAVTRGPFSAAIRSLPTEDEAETETSDGALLAFVPAAVARTIDAEAADRAGFSREVVERLTLRATARLYARQGSGGGFALWDGAEPDPFATARVIRGLVKARDSGMPVDEARLTRAADWLAALDAKAMRDPPVLTDAEKAAIALSGRLAEPGATADDGVRAAVRFLLDRRQGPAWCGPRTTLSAALALLEVRRLAGPTEGEPLPLRIRVGAELIAAVTLSPEELAAGGRLFTVDADGLPKGRIPITFEAGREVRADVTARLTWRGSAPGGELSVHRSLHLLTMTPDGGDSRALERRGDGAVSGDVLGVQILLVPTRAHGPVVVDCPISAGSTLVPPGSGFEAGLRTPAKAPGVVRRGDRVRFLLPRLPKEALFLGFAVRLSLPGEFRLPPIEVRDLETGERLGVSKPGQVSVK